MRRVDTRLAGKAGLVLLVALVLTLALAAVVLAEPSAPEVIPPIPTRPHTFYGDVRTDQGKLLPPGTLVTASAVTGAWPGTITTTVDGLSRYGWAAPFQVPGATSAGPSSGADSGDQIAFFVLGVRARLYDVVADTWSITYPFSYGGHTNLNLSAPISYTITATAGPHGSIAPSGAVKVNYGFDKAFTITPDPNYLILDVRVDGVSNPGAVASGSYTFSNVTDNHSISATFKQKTYWVFLPMIAK